MIIGYTTGVYDMFHIGHLYLLRNAKAMCDYLIVGVTTDELSLERKTKRPIVPYIERVEIVSACRYVDKVVPQSNMDKLSAWENLHFNVVFVGSDWQGTPSWVKYEDQFRKVGVAVVYLPYTNGISSTYFRNILGIA